MIDWNSPVLWGIVSIIGIVLSFMFGFLFFKLGEKTKRLSYDIKSTPLISNNLTNIKGLHITFLNTEIPNLISSQVTIKNVGRDLIETCDFAKAFPLMFITDGQFLVYDDVESFLSQVSNNTCTIQLEQVSSREIIIDFEYLQIKDEMTFNILHTGKLNLTGKLKKGKIENEKLHYNKNKKFKLLICILYCVLSLAIFFLETVRYKTINDSLSFVEVNFVLTMITLIVSSITIYISSLKK